MRDKYRMLFREPSQDELDQGARARFEAFGQFNIDRWPADVAALSMPTAFIALDDPEEFLSLYDHKPGWESLATTYAERIDVVLGWGNHFIKLNSRSPKDATELPITCSGKQALSWILSSERCLDDIVTMWRAKEPIFICCREVRYIPKDSEMRCFALDGVVRGASRYDYRSEPSQHWNPESMLKLAEEFYAQHLAQHYPTVVFDLAPGPLLVELNPYGLSDPCCFGSYERLEAIGGFALTAPRPENVHECGPE